MSEPQVFAACGCIFAIHNGRMHTLRLEGERLVGNSVDIIQLAGPKISSLRVHAFGEVAGAGGIVAPYLLIQANSSSPLRLVALAISSKTLIEVASTADAAQQSGLQYSNYKSYQLHDGPSFFALSRDSLTVLYGVPEGDRLRTSIVTYSASIASVTLLRPPAAAPALLALSPKAASAPDMASSIASSGLLSKQVLSLIPAAHVMSLSAELASAASGRWLTCTLNADPENTAHNLQWQASDLIPSCLAVHACCFARSPLHPYSTQHWLVGSRLGVVFFVAERSIIRAAKLDGIPTIITSIMCDPHDALLHIATEESSPTMLSFNSLTPPTIALPRLPLLLVTDLTGDGFETPVFVQPDSSWKLSSASSQVISYGPVVVPAVPSPAGDSTQQNIGVYLQSRAREATAALKPMEERLLQKDALIANGMAALARITGQHLGEAGDRPASRFSETFVPVLGAVLAVAPVAKSRAPEAALSLLSLECKATTSAGEWIVQASVYSSSASLSLLGLSVSASSIPLQCTSVPMTDVQIDKPLRLAATVSSSCASPFDLALPITASVSLLYHTADSTLPLAFPLGSVTLTYPSLTSPSPLDAPLPFSANLALQSVSSDLTELVRTIKEMSQGRVKGEGKGRAAEITVMAENERMLAVVLHQINALAPEDTSVLPNLAALPQLEKLSVASRALLSELMLLSRSSEVAGGEWRKEHREMQQATDRALAEITCELGLDLDVARVLKRQQI